MRIIRDSLDRYWDGENWEGGEGGNYHQTNKFETKIEGGTILLGNWDDFYALPINVELLRENFQKIGIVLV